MGLGPQVLWDGALSYKQKAFAVDWSLVFISHLPEEHEAPLHSFTVRMESSYAHLANSSVVKGRGWQLGRPLHC